MTIPKAIQVSSICTPLENIVPMLTRVTMIVGGGIHGEPRYGQPSEIPKR
jgi:hypothetical protein